MLLSISGTGVFVSEGFPLPLARKLRDSIADVQTSGPLQVAGVSNQAAGGRSGAGDGAAAFFGGDGEGRDWAAWNAAFGRYTLGQR